MHVPIMYKIILIHYYALSLNTVKKCKELALSNIRSDITVKGTSNKLRTYAKIKNYIVIEDYLIYKWSQKEF